MLLCFFAAEGLKFYDIEEGKGPVATQGSTAQVSLMTKPILVNTTVDIKVLAFTLFRCILIAVTEASLQSPPESIAQVTT